MTTLKQIQQNQIQKEVTINENFNATSPSGIFALKNSSTSGLVFGYYGGIYNNNSGVQITISDGTITLTASSTNYVELNLTNNTVEKNTTSFTSGKVPIAQITTSTNSITNFLDKRIIPLLPNGTNPNLAGSSGSLTTSKVFDITSISGLQVTVQGGRSSWSSSSSQSSVSIYTFSNINITLPASSTGYIYQTNNTITYTTSNIYSVVCRPLYYFVTSGSAITTLEDVRNSFTSFNFYPYYEVYKSTWAIATEYSIGSPGFKDFNTSGNGYNLFAETPMLKCLTSELGYSTNDMVEIINNKPSIIIAQNNIKLVTNSTTPQILNRTAGSVGQLATVTPANWAIICRIKPAQ